MRGIKYKAFDKVSGEWLDSDDLIFQGGCWFKNFRALEDYVALPVDEGEVVIVQFTGLPDIHGNELYDQDVFEELDGTQWKIYYDNELLSWEVTPVNDERFSNQALCEFIDRFNGKLRIDGVKKGNAFEHPHLLKGEQV